MVVMATKGLLACHFLVPLCVVRFWVLSQNFKVKWVFLFKSY